MTTDSTTQPVVRVSIDLAVNGVRDIRIHFNTPEERDEAIQRLNKCLPQLELLEAALQKAG
jgi:subtilisin-like proprotein convertase family protein